jgi:hypothetical protein
VRVWRDGVDKAVEFAQRRRCRKPVIRAPAHDLCMRWRPALVGRIDCSGDEPA